MDRLSGYGQSPNQTPDMTPTNGHVNGQGQGQGQNNGLSSRRPATSELPSFTVPRASDIPRQTVNDNMSSAQGHSYGGSLHGSWSSPSNGAALTPNYGSSHSQTRQSPSQHYGFRQPIYSQQPNGSYTYQRAPPSPAPGADGLPPLSFDHDQSNYHTSITGTPTAHHHTAHHHTSHQPPTPSSLGSTDSYTHTRPQSNGHYHVPSQVQHHQPHHNTQQPSHQQHQFNGFSSQVPSPSNHTHSAAFGAPRVLPPTGFSQHSSSGMTGSQTYRPAYPFHHQSTLSSMGGPVMTNMHQPGGQLSMIPGMGAQHGGYPQSMGHIFQGHHHQGQPTMPMDRPFKCDQCPQSFSRNHDLKRHKRIHLAIKPFPCTFCSKTFSRKDALKRHRLVKGCEQKATDDRNAGQQDDRRRAHSGDAASDDKSSESPPVTSYPGHLST